MVLGQNAAGFRDAFRQSWLAGSLAALGCLYWVYWPVENFGGVHWALALPVPVLLSLAMGAYFGLFGLLAHLACRRLSALNGLLFLGFCWTLMEMAVGTLLSGFPWLTLSSAFVPWTVVVLPASYIGAYGLSEADLRRQGSAQSGGYGGGAGRQEARLGAGQPARTRRPVGSDDANDRKFIEFSIQYPDYIPHLAKRGLWNALSTDWGRTLWQRLSLEPFEDVAGSLGEEDAKMWRTAIEKHPQLAGDDLAEHWGSLCIWIDKQHKEMRRRELMQRLAEYNAAGDVEEVKKVQLAIQALNAPSREEE
jgi:hypothetical protein